MSSPQNPAFPINPYLWDNNADLLSQAKSLLGTPDVSPTADLVSKLLPQRQGPQAEAECRGATALYNYCTEKLPNCLSLKLFGVFKDSQFEREVRDHSITLLFNLLKEKFLNLHREITPDLKLLTISCLREDESSEEVFKILSEVVSIVVTQVFLHEDFEWDELQDYIVSTMQLDFKKALRIVRDLPVIMHEDFLFTLLEKVFEEILNRLGPGRVGIEDWPLAFSTAFMMAVRVADSSRADLSKNVLYAMINSVVNLVDRGEGECVSRGVEELYVLVHRDALKYELPQDDFVMDLLDKIRGIAGIGEETKKSLERTMRVIINQATSKRKMRSM